MLGAVFVHLGGAKLETDPDESWSISTSESRSRWGLTMILVGASAGAVGIILAVLDSR